MPKNKVNLCIIIPKSCSSLMFRKTIAFQRIKASPDCVVAGTTVCLVPFWNQFCLCRTDRLRLRLNSRSLRRGRGQSVRLLPCQLTSPAYLSSYDNCPLFLFCMCFIFYLFAKIFLWSSINLQNRLESPPEQQSLVSLRHICNSFSLYSVRSTHSSCFI